MSCDVARFTITKGMDNTFIFTIKANGSTLPMEIQGTDTFKASLILLGATDNVAVIEKNLTVINAMGGRLSLVITAAESLALISDKGSKTDRYYIRPTYKLLIDCNTVNNGAFIAKVAEVYVD